MSFTVVHSYGRCEQVKQMGRATFGYINKLAYDTCCRDHMVLFTRSQCDKMFKIHSFDL